METWSSYVLLQTAAVLVASAIYWKWRQVSTFWKKHGIQHLDIPQGWKILKPSPIFTDIEFDQSLYQQMKEKNIGVGGYFEFLSPVLFITDLDLLKDIFIKDFDTFTDRRPLAFPIEPALDLAVFTTGGDLWRNLRFRMTPGFSVGKLKALFGSLEESSQKFVTAIRSQSKASNNGVEFRDLFQRYLMDVIVRFAYCAKSDVFENPDSEIISTFRAFNGSFQGPNRFKTVVAAFAPQLNRFPFLRFVKQEAHDFLSNLLKRAIHNRRHNKVVGNDFLQVMLQAQEELQKSGDKFQLTDELINAQAEIFIFGGYETAEGLLVYATQMLAQFPEAQERAYREVKEAVEANGGELTYEVVNELEYMERVCLETVRLFPPLPRIERHSSKEYRVPEKGIVIPAGTTVIAPSTQIHMDPELWEEPEKFNPDRFTKENSANRHICAYLAFGVGPRKCIGYRFALIKSKLLIAKILLNFKLSPVSSGDDSSFGQDGLFKPDYTHFRVEARV